MVPDVGPWRRKRSPYHRRGDESQGNYSTALTLGSLQCRYREGWSDPKPLGPGDPTKLRLQMNNLAYTFPKGSRIALIITSSCCPRILPHRNTMAPTWTEQKPQKAKQEVLHARGMESCLFLPVIET